MATPIATGADLDGRVAIDWGVYGVPETFVIDADGRVAFKHIGPLTAEVVERTIMPLIDSLRRMRPLADRSTTRELFRRGAFRRRSISRKGQATMKTTSRAKASPSHPRRWLIGALALAAIGGLAAVGFSALAQQPASAEAAIPAGANFASWADNGKDGQRVLQLVKGDMPAVGAVVSGVVKTDTNCEPEGQRHLPLP